jgi:hypothetical protein
MGFTCPPSDTYEGHKFCKLTKRESVEQEVNSLPLRRSSSPPTAGLTTANHSIAPAFWNPGELQGDINKLIKTYGEPAIILNMPSHPGLPQGVIAVWGKVNLEALDGESLGQLVAGADLKKGILVDFQNNFTLSAKNGLPVYRLSGSAGYIWIATVTPNSTGTLRFLTIDASALNKQPQAVAPSSGAVPPDVQSPPKPPASPEQVGAAPFIINGTVIGTVAKGEQICEVLQHNFFQGIAIQGAVRWDFEGLANRWITERLGRALDRKIDTFALMDKATANSMNEQLFRCLRMLNDNSPARLKVIGDYFLPTPQQDLRHCLVPFKTETRRRLNEAGKIEEQQITIPNPFCVPVAGSHLDQEKDLFVLMITLIEAHSALQTVLGRAEEAFRPKIQERERLLAAFRSWELVLT